MIWSGLGFLVVVITFACCLLAQFLFDSQLGDGFYSSHPWAAGVALFIGGGLSSVVGFILKERADRYVVDEETGERFVLNMSNHTLFFVPMHWAGVAVAILGIWVAVKGG